MAGRSLKLRSSIDRKSGFCSETKTFHSLRPPIPLPPHNLPLSVSDYVFSLLQLRFSSSSSSSSSSSTSSLATTTALIDAASGQRLSYSEFLRRTEILSYSLQTKIGLSKGDVAFILSPTCIQMPILYFSLLSLGVIISPANPISTESEISRQIRLSNPTIAFATTTTAHKLPAGDLPHPTILLDSPDFQSMMTVESPGQLGRVDQVIISQSDTAAILYSSGTTGRVKGVELTHCNYIAAVSMWRANRLLEKEEAKAAGAAAAAQVVEMVTVPLFHSYGFILFLKAVALGDTMVLMERFDFEGMLRAVAAFGVTLIEVSPPLVVALAKSEVVEKYDRLSSVQSVVSCGAPLGKEVSERFVARFPHVVLKQGYGLTESAIAAAWMLEREEETKRYGSVGRLNQLVEVKVVDTVTGMPLCPGQQGELWFRSPGIMKGYIGDKEATVSTLDNSEGWLKTGDLCYIDNDGFVYIIDRLKELIKYKAYQVPPAELEHILQSHPEIADSAVIPYPDEEAGQIPMAYVVRKPGSNLSEAQVMDFVAKEVAPYKKIRRVAFISSIPKSAAGKILRRVLIDHAISAPSAKL